MKIETSLPLMEEIISAWRDCIGVDYDGYRGHVYRMFNFCLALPWRRKALAVDTKV